MNFAWLNERFWLFLTASERDEPILVLASEYKAIVDWMNKTERESTPDNHLQIRLRLQGFRVLFGRQLQITYDVSEVS